MNRSIIIACMIMMILAGCQPSADVEQSLEDDMKQVTLETTKGTIVIDLYIKEAPITTENFKALVQTGFYNGLTFHRYEPNFVIQGGDPDGDGSGGSERKIPLEIHPNLKHVKGAVAMARTNDPNSASSQFYIALADIHFLDGNYAIFGQVSQGMDNAMKLRAGDKIISATLK